MRNKIKVAMVLGSMDRGGIEKVVFNYFSEMDHTKFQVDFFAFESSTYTLKDEIELCGGHLYLLPTLKHLGKYVSTLKQVFKREKYDIVHVHMNTLSVFALYSAWCAKIPVRIVHNHSTAGKGEFVRNVAKKILKPFSRLFATHYFACSILAGEWMYGKRRVKSGKVKIINNAINVKNFAYNEEVREQVRKTLNIEDKFVIGNIGRFMNQKNHYFLVDIFKKANQIDKSTVMLLIGEGELEDKIKQKVKKLGLDGKIIFLGARNDTNKLYQALDCFVLPSFYEGLPVVSVECQAAGLPCLVSNHVTREANITGLVDYTSLDRNAHHWASSALRYRKFKRKDTSQEVIDAGFDISAESQKLMATYEEMIERTTKVNLSKKSKDKNEFI